jgi:hypothetical protein
LHFLTGDQHPSHLFFFLRKARQIAQFMPQGAMSFVFMKVVVVMDFSFFIQIRFTKDRH